MLSEAHYSAVLNFFFFLLTDEAMALGAAYKAIKHTQREVKRRDGSIDNILISQMHLILEKYREKIHEFSSPPPESNWKVPNREYLAVWREQLRKLDLNAAEVLVLRYILGFEIENISEGLQVPEGTVYYRLGHGLEFLAGTSFSQVAR